MLIDLKRPEHASDLLVKIGALTARPFAVTLDLAARHPWESVERYFGDYRFESLYFGFACIASGHVSPGQRRDDR